MRIVSSVGLLACVCCSHPSPPPSPPPATVRVACRTSVADYCAAIACDRTLAAAEQDGGLCPSTLTACNDITAIAQSQGDTATLWYYQGGPLVAIVRQLSPGYMCLAGPDVFVIPPCALSGQSSPACRS